MRPVLDLGYSFLLLWFVVSAIATHWRTISACTREIYGSFKPGRGEIVVGSIVLCVFIFLNFRHADLPTVMYRHFDELSILRGIESQDISKLVYGSLFTATSLPLLVPGLLLDNFSFSIIGGRMQTALSMIFVALIFRRILALHFRGLPLTLLSLFPFLVPFYWITGTFYHPDALMTALILGSCYFLLKDRGAMGLYLHAACFFFAAALATKMHALMFAPLIVFYFLTHLLRRRSLASLKSVFNAVTTLVVSYLVLEPRMLSLSYLLGVIDDFLYQMWTNKTGFMVASDVTVSLSSKLSTISALYSPSVLLTFLALASTGIFCQRLLSRRAPLTYCFAGIFIVILYYAFFLNKNWAYYYVAPYFLFLALATNQISILCVKDYIGKALAAGIIALQVLIPWSSWERVFADFYMPNSQVQLELNKTTFSLLALFSETDGDASFLISYGIPFDYRSLEIDDSQVRYVVTDYYKAIQQSDYSFLEKLDSDYIILTRARTNNNILLSDFIEVLPKFGYVRIYQDEIAEVYSAKAMEDR